MEQYRKILEVQPNEPISLNNLAMLTIEEEPENALKMAERAVSLRPDDANYVDTLGAVLLHMGKATQAQTVLGEAYKNFPSNPTIGYRYAEALAAIGDRQGARTLLLELVSRNFAEREQAQALLNRL